MVREKLRRRQKVIGVGLHGPTPSKQLIKLYLTIVILMDSMSHVCISANMPIYAQEQL